MSTSNSLQLCRLALAASTVLLLAAGAARAEPSPAPTPAPNKIDSAVDFSGPAGSPAPLAAPEPSATPAASPEASTPAATAAPAPSPASVATRPPAHAAPDVKRPRWGLVVAGALVLAASYISDVALTYAESKTPDGRCFVPLFGPFLQLSGRFGLDGPPYDTGDPAADKNLTSNITTANNAIRIVAQIGLVTDGVLQIGGFAMAVLGATLWKTVPAYARRSGVDWAVLPTGTGGSVFIRW